ncbi:Phosphatidylinositol 4-kinase beta, partial [Perkinsus olseni]
IHDCKVFKTHTRAPFMVTVEIVDLEELEEFGRGQKPRSCREKCDVASGYIMKELGIEPAPAGGEKERSGALRDELLRTAENMSSERWCDMFYREVFEEKQKLGAPPAGRGRMSLGSSSKLLGNKCPKDHKKEKVEKGERIWEFEVLVMVKGGDDVRQEVLAGQLVRILQSIFVEAQMPLWLKPYETVAVDSDCGLMEMLVDTTSIDGLKKEYPEKNLLDIFKLAFGDSKDSLARARKNFIQSLAAYSLFSYFLAVRDRHNGNVLLDRQGHLIDIDFGFMLSSAPGNIPFENAPFKLTQEYIE